MSVMESMGKKKPRPRRSFTPEFKAEIVELCDAVTARSARLPGVST
jgi:transposase-like protein